MQEFEQEGTPVRLKYDPSKTAECTGNTDDDEGFLLVEVRYPNGSADWIDKTELELIDQAKPVDDYELIKEGRGGRLQDFRRQYAKTQLTGKLNEMFYSMNNTHTEFMAHQFKPVLAILDSPSRGLLIADEVGLGKTIEAGLIWTELRFRKNARRLLVVCPAMLIPKWQDELRLRFGTEAKALDARGLAELLQHPERETGTISAYVCSLQGIRPTGKWKEAKEEELTPSGKLGALLRDASAEANFFDLTIIDEAHYMRNPETSSSGLGELLRDVSEYLVLLSATPVNTEATDLHTLVRLVDPEQFPFPEQFHSILDANRPLVQAANLLKRQNVKKKDVVELLEVAKNSWVLGDSVQLNTLIKELGSGNTEEILLPREQVEINERIGRINLLGHVITRTRKREVFINRVERQVGYKPVQMNDVERNFYDLVTQAVIDYAEGQPGISGFLLASPQRQLASSMPAAAEYWLGRRHDGIDSMAWEDTGSSVTLGDSPLIEHIESCISGEVSAKELEESDSKYAELERILLEYFGKHPNEKVIIFSYFRQTLSYLSRRLKEAGIKNLVVKGGDDKQKIINKFRGDESYRVLLASEVASEGVDLQFMRFLINYDLPWNPMKVEQRIGRIDRFGQKAEAISVINMVYDDTIDARILDRLYKRLGLFESSLGVAEEVVGNAISELAKELLSGKLTKKQQEQKVDEAARVLAKKQKDEEVIEENAGELLGLSNFMQGKITQAHEQGRNLSADDIRDVVRDFLEEHVQGHLFVQDLQVPSLYEIALPASEAVEFQTFLERQRLTGTRIASGEKVKVRIDNVIDAYDRSGREVLNQFHPFVRYISARLEETATTDRVICLEIDADHLGGDVQPGQYAFRLEKWHFSGGRDEELLELALIDMASQNRVEDVSALDVIAALRNHSKEWLSAPTEVEQKAHFEKGMASAKKFLSKRFTKEGEQREVENDDRLRVQIDSVKKNADRRAKDIEDKIQRALDKAKMGDKKGLGLIAADKKRLEILKTQTEVRLANLEKKYNLDKGRAAICHGVLKVT